MLTTRRTILVALGTVLTVGVGGCGGGDAPQVRARVGAERSEPARLSATSEISIADVEAFQAEMQETPVAVAVLVGPVSFASLEGRSTARVEATIVDVRQGPTLVGRTTTVACESAEGKPTGEVCEQRDDMETVVFTLDVRRTRNLRGVVPVDAPLELKVTVGPGWSPERERTLETIERIIKATPIGLELIAYLMPSSVDGGYHVLTHPDGWAALVGGQLVSLAMSHSDQPGLVGVTNPDALPT